MEDLRAILLDVVKKDKRHENYDRVCYLADLYYKLVSGDGLDTLLKQFVKRETDEEFKQRCTITQHIVQQVCRNLMNPAYKVPRSNSSTRILAYKDDEQGKKLTKLNKYLQTFWGNKSVDDWMATRWIELNHTDPNTFLVIEWTEEKPPYPFEVSAKQAIYYEYDNNILQYLVGWQQQDITVIEAGNEKEKQQNIYTIYGMNEAVRLEQVFDDTVRGYAGTVGEVVQVTTTDGRFEFVQAKRDEYYRITEVQYQLGYVPAFMVGYCRDLQTAGMTYVSPIDESTPTLMNMITAKSELDLTMKLHAFPQKIQYVKRCTNPECNRGYLPDGMLCGRCHGEGLDVHTSAQDIVRLEMPRTKEELIELSNIIRYEYPPVDLLRFQDEYIKNLIYQCREAVFNSDIYSRKEIAETATGKNISLQAVYDTLYPEALAFSEKWQFTVETIATIEGIENDLIASYRFNKDFKLKSLDDLYADLQTVTASQADNFIKQQIQNDIARIIYSENPEEYKKYIVKQSFYPYSGKTPEQIMVLNATNDIPEFQKVLWANYGWIFDDIELEQAEKNVNFYELNKSKQYEILKEKVNEIIGTLDAGTEPVFTAE